MLTTFLLIRHAQTKAVGQYLSGTAAGLHLSDEGRVQAAELASTLAGTHIDRIASSPLERTLETANAIASGRSIPIETFDGLIEFEVGEWTGRTFDALSTDRLWRQFNDARSITRPPRGELMVEVQARAWNVLLTLDERHPSKTIAVVSHGDVLRTIVLCALGTPIDFYHRVEISPARITVLRFDAGVPRLLQVNGDSVPPLS